jgi:hypothetical protein
MYVFCSIDLQDVTRDEVCMYVWASNYGPRNDLVNVTFLAYIKGGSVQMNIRYVSMIRKEHYTSQIILYFVWAKKPEIPTVE